MATFIDEARTYRAQGATRRQLISYIKLYGVDDDRAQRLADRLDMELGLLDEPMPRPPEPVAHVTPEVPAAAPVTAGIPLPAPPRSAEQMVVPLDGDDFVIDLTDGARSTSLQRAPDAQTAINRAQQMIDEGTSRQVILEYLVYNGVTPAEAAHVATTIRASDDEIQIIPPAHPVRRRRRRHNPRLSLALAQIVVGVLIGYLGYEAAVRGYTWDIGEVWFVVIGGAITLFGLKNVMDSGL